MPTMEANIRSLVGSLNRALVRASDTKARIVGLTYPDVELGLYVFPADPPAPASVLQAQASVLAFDNVINPTLKKAYLPVSRSSTRSSFVNVTSAPYGKAIKGDDTVLSLTEHLAPYGTVPVSVAEVCQLTYFCSPGNIHATTQGYTFIGKLVVADVLTP